MIVNFTNKHKNGNIQTGVKSWYALLILRSRIERLFFKMKSNKKENLITQSKKRKYTRMDIFFRFPLFPNHLVTKKRINKKRNEMNRKTSCCVAWLSNELPVQCTYSWIQLKFNDKWCQLFINCYNKGNDNKICSICDFTVWWQELLEHMSFY